MQKLATFKEFTTITPTAGILAAQHGGRAKCLQRLIRLGLPVPETVALSFETVHGIAAGRMPDVERLLNGLGPSPLVSVRPSSEDPDWGGPGAVLNIGMNDARHEAMCATHGEAAASALYLRFIQTFASQVTHLDSDLFDTLASPTLVTVGAALQAYETETETRFPQDPAEQLRGVLLSMAQAWESTSARLLRQAKGAPADAGLGLVVQTMALGVGAGESGSGVIQFVESQSGRAQVTGRYLSQSQGRDALTGREGVIFLTRDPRGPSFEELCPDLFDKLVAHGEVCRNRLRDEMEIEFTVESGHLSVIDAVRVQRSARAAVSIAVALAEDDVIPKSEAILRIPPRTLNEVLHPQIDPKAKRSPFLTGIPVSPGAASGRIVLSTEAAQTRAARGEDSILVKRETSPEDVRGMHVVKGVLTERGGMTSHAAVIARGLGVPCVVGASRMTINRREGTITTVDGQMFSEGDIVTLDGATGEVFSGTIDTVEMVLEDAFETLLDWADDVRDIGVRVNADTPDEARTARRFKAEGIGLCRTEHMFYSGARLTAMREMIFADSPEDRAEALAQLLPMQRTDFTRLFKIMDGKPVCIRLFDPPLHEFLPRDRQGMIELAGALNLPLSDVQRRIDTLSEFNPMLGLRGVRVGITVPEIYAMQARAIFEAALDVAVTADPVVPEIMIPLVSARREVELVKAQVDQVASAVQLERGETVTYRLGVMVETPRAALMARDIALQCDFLSFGTNDLTQMTYGLSRDDAGRFMGDYVRQKVFREDPFHTLDQDGVGELLRLGAERGRSVKPDITLSICGEHGGNAESIGFCRESGFDYVSCSPYRLPLARLAAAQLALNSADR